MIVGLVPGEGRRAERMVRMNMRHQHMANRLVGPLPDFAEKPFPVRKTAARIGDKNGVAADDDADIGNTTRVG